MNKTCFVQLVDCIGCLVDNYQKIIRNYSQDRPSTMYHKSQQPTTVTTCIRTRNYLQPMDDT
jgi:hypothetical protein